MKRHGGLFDRITSRAELYRAYHDAKRDKRSTRSCREFELQLAGQVERLHQTLRDGTYRPKPYNVFWIHEPKLRQISAPAFRDRVVQHSIYNAVLPIFDRGFIDQSFACRKGRGTHMASDYLQAALQASDPDSYVLQMDVRRYYYRIDREILRRLIERKIKDRRVVDLMAAFAEGEGPLGVPIGNLLSQLYGLIYLNPMDHFIKRQLKARRYARYVDDFVLVGLSLAEARRHAGAIEAFLREQLGLELSRAEIYKVRRGVNFVGFRTWRSARFVRKHALYTFRRAAKRGALDSVIASLGHARRTASLQHMLDLLMREHHELYLQLPESVRRLHDLRGLAARGRRRALRA